jgi:hypothetical protein
VRAYLSCPISPGILGGVPAREESSESANLCLIGAASITLSPCTATIALGLRVVKNDRNNRAATTSIPRLANSFTPLLSSWRWKTMRFTSDQHTEMAERLHERAKQNPDPEMANTFRLLARRAAKQGAKSAGGRTLSDKSTQKEPSRWLTITFATNSFSRFRGVSASSERET